MILVVILELSNSLEKQIDKTQKFLDHLSVLSNCIHNAQATKQQVDTTAEYTENISKPISVLSVSSEFEFVLFFSSSSSHRDLYSLSKQQVDTTAEYTENIAKCMEIARRISEGAKVPYSDERKLMK